MLVQMVCPGCGAKLEFDDDHKTMFCQYCGNKIANIDQNININENVTITHKKDISSEPNLHITYASTSPEIIMVTRIVSSGQKSIFTNGQSASYYLPHGEQVVVLKIGKRNYNRKIYLPEDNSPVTIRASFTGRANIEINQPPYEKPATPTNTAGVSTPNASTNSTTTNTTFSKPASKTNLANPVSPLSIVAFVFSLTFYFSFVGIGLGVWDLKRNDNDHHHIFSYIAIAVGSCLTLLTILSFIIYGLPNLTSTDSTESVSSTQASYYHDGYLSDAMNLSELNTDTYSVVIDL